jgi:hypothetical protein
MANIQECLEEMKTIYWQDPVAAVRSQSFIQTLHKYIEEDLNDRISPKARRNGVKVVREARLFGSYKAKDVDVAVIHPVNGPLITVGVRSQMSSVAKNALTYYQDIIGESISLQERFPMTTMGYVYLHPYKEPIADKKIPDHKRWAQLYANIGKRDDRLYKNQIGSYDQFAYMIVDFDDPQLEIRDDIIKNAIPDVDLQISTLTNRLIDTFTSRNIWLEDLFI